MSIRRNEIGIAQAINLAGEQTYMRNARVTGSLYNEQLVFNFNV